MTDAYQYDLAFACTLDAVNKQLTAGFAHLDATCHYSGADSTEKATVAVDATFAPWVMTTGGSNKLLRFSVPFASGSFTIDCPSLGLDNKHYDLSGVAVEVEVQLGWLGNGSTSSDGTGSNTQLAFNLTTKGTHLGDTTAGAVTPVSVTDPQGHLDSVASAVFEDVIADVLIANKSKINFVFATINPAPPGAQSWLAPKRWNYYYQQPASGPAVLCVLSVLTDRELPSTPAFDSSVLSQPGDVFMILSKAQFLEHGVLPGLKTAYGSNDFAITTMFGMPMIHNTANISTKTASWGADTYYPYLESIVLAVDGSSVTTSISGRCDITGLANAYVTFSGTKSAASTYTPGTGVLSFAKPSGKIDTARHIPWYDWVLGALSGGVGIAIIDSVMAAVTSTVTDAVGDAVSSTGDAALGKLAINTCSWAGSSVTPTAGGLSGAFWMTGTAN